MAVPLWKRAKRSVRAALVRGGVRLLSRLPLRAALAVGGVGGRMAWALSPALRCDMRAGLGTAFPEQDAARLDAIARDSLVHLGWVGGEMVAFIGRPQALERYVEVAPEALATIHRVRLRGRGIVMVLGHIGNWELTCRLAPLLGSVGVIAKRTWHRSLDVLAERARAANGVATLWRSDAGTGRSMLKLLKTGGTLGILIDQDIESVQNVFVPFFHRLAATPRGAADLALRSGAAVLVVTCHRRGPKAGDGHRLEVVEVPYDASASDGEAEVVRLTAACTRLQEAAIRSKPAEWVWMHRRWKTRPVPEGTVAAGSPERRRG
ncbi:MAG TPA: lipid A biosynthesis acyltransferase [Anaeromyxobacter sp.]|nr:lipid A biosynthesis acyltransferase [Anaeromyxobacter sp.]